MFSEEIQRTIQQRQLQSGSQKHFVLDKVPESVFLTWLFQQYELLHQLQIASNETYSSVSSLLADTLRQQNAIDGFKTFHSTGKCLKDTQRHSSLCYSHSSKLPGALKAVELSQNLCNIKQLGTLSASENVSLVSSAFCQISLSENSNRFQNGRTIHPINEVASSTEKAYLINKERYIESTENHICNLNVDLNNFSSVHTSILCREEPNPFPNLSPSLYLSVIPQTSTLEILNNTILYPVPHHSENLSPKTERSTIFQPSHVGCDNSDQNDQPLQETLVKTCSESNSSLPLFFLKSDSVRDSFHSIISSSMAQFNEERLDDECFNTFDQLDPPIQRNLQNPVAKLLSGGDDQHFIPIEDEMVLE